MFSDVRDERLLQQHLVEAKEAAEEAVRLKADFLSTMSHEIRTPLNGVIGMTDILLDTQLDPEQIEFVRIIKTSADALTGTIDDILDFSKIEAGRLELELIEFSLQQVIESSVDIVALRAQEKKLTLASYIDPALPDHFIGDPLRIRQVLLNFLSNAVKFSERGQILVSGASETHPTSAASSGPRVRISVHDSGIGIGPEAMERLFQPFSQADSSTSRKYGGTGLGLVICKRLVEAMGGRIGVDSEPGCGATFWMTLPLAGGRIAISKLALAADVATDAC
jgi:two-component system, sensor histidine kinase and response regulator